MSAHAQGEPSFRQSVDLMFNRAVALMDLSPGLEEKIRVCNSTYTVRFGVRLRGKIEDDHFYAYAQKDGKLYKAGAPAGLFVMHKLDPSTANTDQGWVYGTVAPDGQTVTSAGRVGSCMGCHQQAPNGRLFGISYSGA